MAGNTEVFAQSLARNAPWKGRATLGASSKLERTHENKGSPDENWPTSYVGARDCPPDLPKGESGVCAFPIHAMSFVGISASTRTV
ncbi:hypothetical protein NDU88_005475 [Pleurodeles waltl]|uniref:Uncharacterized protein n=1 Tax=Pleurodeles waltl TaxID=8319 RepID=A0AAV7QKS0_PLEWA|nr:hypothetical protein NDU88_005475 [Pleurodeles waltl]